MKNTQKKYQYLYQSNHASHHHQFLISPLLEILSEVKRRQPSVPRILDIGCGNGSLTNFIAQQGYEVVGIEDSDSGINFAQSSFSNCKFIQANIYDLPYEDLKNSFDIVMAVEVIEHLIYPRELLKSAKKCLKPNGHLVLTTPYHGYLKNLSIALLGKQDKHFNPLWDGGHIKFFSVSSLNKLLLSEGYGDIEFKFAGRFPYFWKSMICLSRLINS